VNRFWSALFSLVFASLTAVSQPLPPENAFAAFHDDARHFAEYVQWMEKNYPNAISPLLSRLNGTPEPWYHPQFDLLLKVTTPIPPDKQRVDWVFSKWAVPFSALTLQLRDQWKATRNAAELQALFFNVHDTYAHAIPAAYLLER